MRNRLTLTSLMVMLTLCTSCDRARPPAGASAEVTPDKATFTIPVEQRPVWEWHVASTPFDAFEYDWSIYPKGVKSWGEQGTKSFGFSVWKNGDQPPMQGDLFQMVKAGQGTIWEANSDGGGHRIGTIVVRAIRQGTAVEMVVSEQQILKELLAERPQAVEVVAGALDTDKDVYSIARTSYSIPVIYRDR